MKRIHYGAMTIDTTDKMAETVIEIAQQSANTRQFRGRAVGRGMMTEPFSVGHTIPLALVGYVDGGSDEVEVSLIVGAGIAVAISESPVNLPEPPNADVVQRGLEEQLRILQSPE